MSSRVTRIQQPARRGAAVARKKASAGTGASTRGAPKATAVRSPAPPFPTHVRAVGVEVSDEERAYIRHKLAAKLGKFSESIERVSVRLEDVNGPRGGVDQVCRIKVVLGGLPSAVFEQREATLAAAVEGALAGTQRAVRRDVQRRRMKPIQRPVRAKKKVQE